MVQKKNAAPLKKPDSISLPLPNLQYEKKRPFPVCGIDEAGRGPLAGPVVAAAIILNPDTLPIGLQDSKKLTPQKRIFLAEKLKQCAHIGLGISEPEEIDRLNILKASLLAMQRAFYALNTRPAFALIDGPHLPILPCPAQAIIKGDSKSLSIAAASIIAKTYRDQLMTEADERFPGYAFSSHKGYPTKTHKEYLNILGPSPIHRLSFAPVKTWKTRNNRNTPDQK